MTARRVCVFCGSNSGTRPDYVESARALGVEIARRDLGLVFGGGCVGLMGVVADAVLAGGGHVIGVIPHALVARELAHLGVQDLRVVASMHDRKALMAELADAFLALPGGFGTFEEVCEAITWTQLGLHDKRCGLLNIGGFYDPLLAQFHHAANEGFIKASNLAILSSGTSASELLDEILRPLPAPEPKWIRRPQDT